MRDILRARGKGLCGGRARRGTLGIGGGTGREKRTGIGVRIRKFLILVKMEGIVPRREILRRIWSSLSIFCCIIMRDLKIMVKLITDFNIFGISLFFNFFI